MRDNLTKAAENAYNNYSLYTGGKTYDGRRMPFWDELPYRIRDAWVSAVADLFYETNNLEARLSEAEDTIANLRYDLELMREKLDESEYVRGVEGGPGRG